MLKVNHRVQMAGSMFAAAGFAFTLFGADYIPAYIVGSLFAACGLWLGHALGFDAARTKYRGK